MKTLIEQARELKRVASCTDFYDKQAPKQFKDFLDAVIPILEAHERESTYFTGFDEQRQAEQNAQRTHTLAIMAAVIYESEWHRVKDDPVHPDEIENTFQLIRERAVSSAAALLGTVEKRVK